MTATDLVVAGRRATIGDPGRVAGLDPGLVGRGLERIEQVVAGAVDRMKTTNSTVPFRVAAMLGIPVVDADGMGRAFPEIQMVTATVYGISATPMALADEKGNTAIIDTLDNHWAERLSRSITIDMGCVADIAL